MKRIAFLIFIISVSLFYSCRKDTLVPYAVPVIRSLQDIRASVKVEAAKETHADGKIYVTNQYLFYIAQKSGIHIFDNQNPSHPINKLFINIEGVHDIAVKGNYLYADNYVDLLVFDISDINAVRLVKTVEKVIDFFPVYSVATNYYAEEYPAENEIITAYKMEMRKKPRERRGIFHYEDMAMPMTANTSGSATGIGGSYAKFQINGNALYTTETNALKIFNISNPATTYFFKTVPMSTWTGAGVFETLFKQGNYMFVGATNGMYVFDASDAFNLQYISSFSHATACDPVVVEGTKAYITLRNGTTCNAAIEDQINVIDISNIQQPVLTSSYLVKQPQGLGIKDNVLYVCCGNDGLKVFDAANSSNLLHMKTYAADVTDVIPLNSHLIAVGKNKIIQYAYADHFSLEPISTVNF